VTSRQVLAEFARRGLERPTYEDALQFGIQYPERQRKDFIVFPHKSVRGSDRRGYVLVLGGDADSRILYFIWCGGKWTLSVFAGVRKSA